MLAAQLILNRYVTTIIRGIREETESIRCLELGDPDDWELPPFSPGAHIDVHLTNDLVRQYSLCGDPSDKKRYYIAVLADRMGRGGSLYIHEKLKVGDALSVSLPRNLFSVASQASYHLLIAGGIGLTPFMSMIPALLQSGQPFHFHVCTKDRTHTPFRAQLDGLIKRGLVTLHHRGRGADTGLDIAQLLKVQQPNAHVYCCGPQRMIEEFQTTTRSWPENNVHYERFSAESAVGNAYTLELSKSGRSIEVMESETMVSALNRNGFAVRTACRAGICGICRINYLEGKPDHRDHVLSDEQRRISLMPCVSGSLSPSLVLDL
jgi:ferredoxin-NADP reductase